MSHCVCKVWLSTQVLGTRQQQQKTLNGRNLDRATRKVEQHPALPIKALPTALPSRPLRWGDSIVSLLCTFWNAMDYAFALVTWCPSEARDDWYTPNRLPNRRFNPGLVRHI